MVDVLLIYPSVSYKEKIEDIKEDLLLDYPPLGYLYIAASLEKMGFSVKVIDTTQALTLRQTMKIIGREKPKIIGLSALTSNMPGAYQLAQKIKDSFGDKIKVGLGGHHISCDPEVVKRFSCFDFGVTGEGEITLSQLADRIINKKEKIKGPFVGEIPRDLDALPFPARHLVDFKNYPDLWANNLVASRGCPYKCIFCSRPAVSKIARFRNPALVVEEMRPCQAMTGKQEYVFLDDTINLNQNYTLALCDAIIKSKITAHWSAQARLNLINEKLIKKMSQAGCVKLMFGVESGNNRVRNEIINKFISDEQIKTGFTLSRKYGIEADAFLMVGFPTETKEEIKDTVNFGKKFNPSGIGVHVTIPLPGSFLWNDLVQKKPSLKRIIDQYIKGKLKGGFRKSWPKYIPQGLTLGDLTQARNKAHHDFYLRPAYVWYRLKKDLTSWTHLKKDIVEAYSLIKFGRSHWGD